MQFGPKPLFENISVKFGETIREALNREPERPAAFVGLEKLPQRFDIVPADAGVVKAFIAERT
jgi:threonine synthase